ncbi:MAG: response regulator [Sphaerochaetaceae bacterium]|nr:response regulator [Spirochaetaceae bacterium]MDY6343603.1 response regulator [Sphaerochaetaceae bacterium]
MFQVLIADDEPIVLEGMRLFPWSDIGCEVAGEAEDGIVALDMVKHLHPDIVISDIRMPGMDGLSLASAVHTLNPQTEILLITGFSEFAYARKALQIGVVDFLVKPVSFTHLHDALAKATERLMKKREAQEKMDVLTLAVSHMLPKVQDQILHDAIEGTCEEAGSDWSLDKEQFVIAALYCDTPKGLEIYMLRDYLSRLVEQVGGLLVYEYRRYIVLFRFLREMDENSCRKMVERRIENVQLDAWKQYRFTFSAGVSMVGKTLQELPWLKQQALTSLHQSQIAGKNLVVCWQGEGFQKISPERLSGLRTELFSALQSRDMDGLDMALRKLEQLMESSPRGVTLIHSLWEEVVCLLSLPCSDAIFEETQSDVHSYMVVMSQRLHTVLRNLQVEDMERQKEVGVVVENYIKEHFAEDISLSDLSEVLCYNTAYLSRLISKHCGQSFVRMLVMYRMERAKELLRTTNDQIAKIAAAVGYNDVGYFITTFRKHEGLTPADYRLGKG